MHFLFDNPLANMPGVVFLIFYSLSAVFALVIFGIWKMRADRTGNLPVPPIPANIDPYEIAFLRGGMNEVARAVVFALRQKNFLIFRNDGKDSRIHRDQMQTDTRGLNEMEQAVLNWFAFSRAPKEVFQGYGYGLTDVLAPYAAAYEAKLEQRQFLNDGAARSRAARARNVVLLLILGLGGYKLTAALLHGRFNVLGIIIISVIAALITFAAARMPRLSKLGKTYLERLQMAFDQLKQQTQQSYRLAGAPKVLPGSLFAGGIDPVLLSVGVFGGSFLAGTIYDDYSQAFQKAQNQALAGSSGCGSACGSSCSSSSGGDGGGGGCGGGCGGGGCGGCS